MNIQFSPTISLYRSISATLFVNVDTNVPRSVPNDIEQPGSYSMMRTCFMIQNTVTSSKLIFIKSQLMYRNYLKSASSSA